MATLLLPQPDSRYLLSEVVVVSCSELTAMLLKEMGMHYDIRPLSLLLLNDVFTLLIIELSDKKLWKCMTVK
jgi:hypothetical protein